MHTDELNRAHTLPLIEDGDTVFNFLELPVELRLKIYGYLLLPRKHVIVAQYPNTGYFYNTALIPIHSAPSSYPFGRKPPRDRRTTYRVLNTNFCAQFPAQEIFPEILRVCRQVRTEAEPVLYGHRDTVFDFGVHTDAMEVFFKDRSALARASVANLRIAKEVPDFDLVNVGGGDDDADWQWNECCSYILSSLSNLKNIDLTVWSQTGSLTSIPPPPIFPEAREEEAQTDKQPRWADWRWTCDLLKLEVLRRLLVTYWGFNLEDDEDHEGDSYGRGGFDSWLAKSMLSDELVRKRMLSEGRVVEGVVALEGAYLC